MKAFIFGLLMVLNLDFANATTATCKFREDTQSDSVTFSVPAGSTINKTIYFPSGIMGQVVAQSDCMALIKIERPSGDGISPNGEVGAAGCYGDLKSKYLSASDYAGGRYSVFREINCSLQ